MTGGPNINIDHDTNPMHNFCPLHPPKGLGEATSFAPEHAAIDPWSALQFQPDLGTCYVNQLP